MFAPTNSQTNNNTGNAKWQDKFVFHYGVDAKQTSSVEGFVHNNSVLLSPTTPTTTNKCCIPSPFQVPTDDVFFGANKTATYIPPSSVITTAPLTTTTLSHDDFFLLDTPKSAFCPASVSTAVPQGDLVFKFEPEHIELMNKCDHYMDDNYNEDNCQSKHYSPCNTPPSGANQVDSHIYNNFDFTHYQTPLPPINTIQSSVAYPSTNHYDDHFIDTSFLAQYPSPVPRRVHQTEYHNDSYSQPANFNVTGDDKPNREFKHIAFDEPSAIKTDESDLIHEDTIGDAESSLEPVTCLWTDCHKDFCSQTELVAHIEKLHIEGRKGEEFSCFWRGCSRAKKPFNARYKLLIHMRVHSGEKPNKCPVSKIN